jgi:hypothetical protein
MRFAFEIGNHFGLLSLALEDAMTQMGSPDPGQYVDDPSPD